MIGKLKGIVDFIAKDHMIIDVSGVGYVVYCSAKTLSKLPEIGIATSLLIETHVREDNISLYGFMEEEERYWFKDLITVKGLGVRIALNILSNLTPKMISNSIALRDKLVFKQITGVGPKLAERIFIELKDKAAISESSAPKVISVSNQKYNDLIEDAVSALLNLGYNKLDSVNICNKIIANNSEISLSELLKISLKELSR